MAKLSKVFGNKVEAGFIKIFGASTGEKESVIYIYAANGNYDSVTLILPSISEEGYLYNDGNGNLSFRNIESSMGAGPKSSMVDAGNFGEMSLTDDYLYICVQTGTAGLAIWKRVVMFNTP